MFRLALLAAACFTAASCSTTYGNKEIVQTERIEALAKAPDCTKESVYAALGQPADVLPAGKGTSWIYLYRLAKPNALGYAYIMGLNNIIGGKNGDVHTRSFRFDEKGAFLETHGIRRELYTSDLFTIGRTIGVALTKDAAQARVEQEMTAMGRPFDQNLADDYQKLREAMN